MPCTVPSSRHAMQRVEHNIGRGFGQPCGNIAAHVDPGHAMATFLQRLGHAFAAHQRNGAFTGPAAHQDNDMKGG